ncbi:MAG: hypothetical protein L0Z62_32555 [Gemmataceae bacterium]|nr:hypothetical protein [Gemmataceae bacterium]
MNPRCERCLMYFCFLAGVGLLAWGTSLYLAPAPSPALEVAQTDLEVADAIPGQQLEVVLRFHNNSGQPLRIYGLALC